MNQSNILSVKFSRTDKNQKVTVGYFYPEMNRNRTEEITDVPHADFMAAILNLSPFLARIFHAEDSTDYVATGLSFQKENHVIITGKMSSSTGTLVGISSPMINLEELDSYEEFKDLDNDLDEVVAEVSKETLLLLNGTKIGVRQSTIDDAIAANEADKTETEGLFASSNENNEGEEDEQDKDEGLEELENLPDQLGEADAPGNDDFVFPDDLKK